VYDLWLSHFRRTSGCNAGTFRVILADYHDIASANCSSGRQQGGGGLSRFLPKIQRRGPVVQSRDGSFAIGLNIAPVLVLDRVEF
jgi:hypothetical protein